MKMIRRGSERYRGITTVIPDRPVEYCASGSYRGNVAWSSSLGQILIGLLYVPHFDGRTVHNYTAMLSVEDISSLLSVIGHACSMTDAHNLREILKSKLPLILNMISSANGFIPSPNVRVMQLVNS